MHRILALAILIAAGCTDTDNASTTPVAAIDAESTALAEIPPAPKFSIDRSESDLGRISSNEHTTEFRISNVGNAPLKIHQIDTSCTCSDAVIEDGVIEPGESTRLVVTVDGNGSGEKSAQVALYTNDPRQPQAMLLVSWTSVDAAEAIPPRIDLGPIRPGENVTCQVDILRHLESLEWEDRRVTVSDGISVSETTVSEGMLATLDVTTTGGSDEGSQTGYITFSPPNAGEAFLTIPVTWEVVDLVTVVPSRVFLGTGEAGEVLRRQFVIRSNVAEPVEVGGIEFDGMDDGLNIDFPPASAQVLVFDVTLALPEALGSLSGEIQVTLAKPEARTITIPVSAIVVNRSSGDSPCDE